MTLLKVILFYLFETLGSFLVFEILTKFSDSMAEKLSMCKLLRPYNS